MDEWEGSVMGDSQLPKVSLIIPAYNAEKYVLDAIRSIDAQRYSPLEILLVDDGSTDGTVGLVKHAAPHVKVVQQANAGAAAARNTGLKVASGELVTFLDADDGWFPGKLAAQVDYLMRHPEVNVVFHKWLVWQPNENGQFATPVQPEEKNANEIDPDKSGWLYTRLLFDCIVHTSSVMLRRKVIDQIGYFKTDLVIGEDYDYWLRVSRLFEMHKLDKTYSYYRETPGSLTKRPYPENNEYRVLMNAINTWGLAEVNGLSIQPEKIAGRLHQMMFDFGYGHYHRGVPSVARSAFAQALKHSPVNWRTWAYLFLASLKAMRQ